MSVSINSSTTNYFDYSVNYNLYTRQITLNDLSSYKVGGAALVQGIDFVITSPSGITLWSNTNYAPADIEPSAPAAFIKSMAFFGGGVEVGNYTIVGTFKDQSGTTYSLTKITNICLPTQNTTSSAANGCVTLGWTVRCIDNLVIVADQTPFSLTINGIVYAATTVTYGVTVVNPLGVILANNVNLSYFQVTPVVNGSYSIIINDTAIYIAADNVTVTVHYLLIDTKKAECNINLCDVYCCVADTYKAWQAIEGNGSVEERTLKEKWQELSLLVSLTQIAISCGNNTSSLLESIEDISGCSCSCGCGISNVNQGVNVLLGQNYVIQSGNGITIASLTVGNTTTVTVTNSLPENNKVKNDVGDNAPDYLFNKIESTGASVTITDVDSGGGNKKSNFEVAAGLMTGVLNFQVSFETGEVGTIHLYPGFKCTVTGIWATVSKAIAATDNGTITPKNNAGATMTGGVLTAVLSSAVGTDIGLNTITANNTIGTADVIQITTAKVTAGGRCMISLQYTRTL